MVSIIIVGVGCFFLITAALKAFYSRLFIVHVGRFKLLPERPAALLAVLFIEMEAGIGAALIFGLHLDLLIPLVFCLVIVFSLIAWWGYRYRNLDDCGCYGGMIRFSRNQVFAINGIILLALGAVWFWGESGNHAFSESKSIYYVIAVILFFHFIAKKTVKRPLFDLLGLKAGRRWRSRVFDLSAHQADRGESVFFFLDSGCPLCRSWLQQLNDLTPGEFKANLIVLIPAKKIESFRQDGHLTANLPVHAMPDRVDRLLAGQLPLAVFVLDGRITGKRSGAFPEEMLYR